jgi:hypothetical protein
LAKSTDVSGLPAASIIRAIIALINKASKHILHLLPDGTTQQSRRCYHVHCTGKSFCMKLLTDLKFLCTWYRTCRSFLLRSFSMRLWLETGKLFLFVIFKVSEWHFIPHYPLISLFQNISRENTPISGTLICYRNKMQLSFLTCKL